MSTPTIPKGPVLTQTIIDLADCHTTLYYLGASKPTPAPLPLSNAADYASLYKTVAVPGGASYGSVRGQNGIMLDRIKPVYQVNKYWDKYMKTRNRSVYANMAWARLLPLKCSLLPKIDFLPNDQVNMHVSPHPRVLLYPFGWSTWVSLLLNGEHTLKDLAAFVKLIFTDKIFRINPAPSQNPADFSLRNFFDYVADGVRDDAFGGTPTDDQDFQDIAAVTTVLGKHGLTYSLDGMSSDQEQLLLRVVNPEGPAPKGDLKDYALRRKSGDSTQYVVTKDYRTFIWMDNLLDPVGRNRQHLRCYHNNTFYSIVQARHLHELLLRAGPVNAPLDPLAELTLAAAAELEPPARDHGELNSEAYCNISLVKFLDRESVANARQKAENLAKPKS